MNTETKLYRIIVLHAAPKDHHISIETYLSAKSEEDVLEWLDKDKTHGRWSDAFADGDTKYDDDTEEEIPLRDYLLKHKGELYDNSGYEDAYYGVTKWGWEEVPASPEEIQTLLKLGIAIQL